jgi:hypothetical protein
MKKILLVLIGGAMIGLFAVSHARLPAPPPKSDAEKAGEAAKAAAAKAKDGELNAMAQDRAVANYKKGKGISMGPDPKAAKAAKKK